MSATTTAQIDAIAAAGSGTKGTLAAAGAVTLNEISNATDARVATGDAVIISSTLDVDAKDDSTIQSLQFALSGSSSFAIAASVVDNVIGNTIRASI